MLGFEPNLEPPELSSEQQLINELNYDLEILRRTKSKLIQRLEELQDEIVDKIQELDELEGNLI